MSRFALLVAALSVCAQAQAKDLHITGTPTQSDFRGASEDVIATIEYKDLGPAAWSGITGFEIAAIGSYLPTEHRQEWKNLTGQNVRELGLVGARVQKGLPLDLDVGAFYSGVPEYGVGVYGAELRYAILPGSIALPALAVRGTYDQVRGLDDFNLRAATVDASVSKGFAFLSPYVGGGFVWGVSEPKGQVAAVSGLQKETIHKPKFFAGVRISLGLLHLTPEFETIGSNKSYNLNFGIHW